MNTPEPIILPKMMVAASRTLATGADWLSLAEVGHYRVRLSQDFSLSIL
jgi:hypothetical protein